VKFAFIQAEKATFPVTVLCRVLQVSRAGFYAAHQRPRPGRAHQAREGLRRATQAAYGSTSRWFWRKITGPSLASRA
jgi:hypothetical protein